MKKLLITAISGVALVAATVSSYAQGEISFVNSAATAFTYGTGGANTPGTKLFGAAGTYSFSLYVGAFGDTTLSQMTLATTVNSANAAAATSFTAGLISGGNVILPAGFGNGTQYADMIVAYTTADGSYAASVADGHYAGISALGSITPSTSPIPQVVGSTSGVGFAQIPAFALNVTSVPEPATIALGGLGAAALLLFRRKKK